MTVKITRVAVDQSGAGTTVLMAADRDSYHKVLGAMLTLSAAGTMQFTDGTEALTGPTDFATDGGFVLPFSKVPYFETKAAGRPLNLVSVTGEANGFVIVATASEPEEAYVVLD
jgi:hypothetical protein